MKFTVLYGREMLIEGQYGNSRSEQRLYTDSQEVFHGDFLLNTE